MPEFLVLCFLLIPQIVAGILAKSRGRRFWVWFFISFLMPIISLVVLLMLEDKSGNQTTDTGYQLADHVRDKENS